MGDAGGSVDSAVNTANAVNTTSASTASAAATGAAAVAATGDALVASITNMLDSVFANIDQAITRTKNWNEQTHHHHSEGGDRYVTGDTNWDTYDLPTLVSMVAAPASPSQVQSVAGLWRSNGSAITQGAENLSQSLTALMNYWQGAASQQVASSVADTAGWITAVGETAGKVADQVEDASGALQSAQNTMPGAPTSPFWTAYNTAAGGATAGTAGGPFGVAAGTMMGSLQSVFVASNDNGAEKQQAVQTMQRFEQAGVNIDTTTPTFTAPPVWGSAAGSSAGGAGHPGAMVTVGTQSQGQPTTGVNLSTLPSLADSPTGRWDGLTGGPGGDAAGVGGAHGGSFAGFGMFGGGGGGFGKGSETERASVPTIQPNNAGAAAVAGAGTGENPAGIVGRTTDSAAMGGSVMEEVDPRAAGGGMGTPMGAGMMGGARGAGGSEEEFRRRIPYEEDPFITGLKAVPPVIGLSSLDREADR